MRNYDDPISAGVGARARARRKKPIDRAVSPSERDYYEIIYRPRDDTGVTMRDGKSDNLTLVVGTKTDTDVYVESRPRACICIVTSTISIFLFVPSLFSILLRLPHYIDVFSGRYRSRVITAGL